MDTTEYLWNRRTLRPTGSELPPQLTGSSSAAHMRSQEIALRKHVPDYWREESHSRQSDDRPTPRIKQSSPREDTSKATTHLVATLDNGQTNIVKWQQENIDPAQ